MYNILVFNCGSSSLSYKLFGLKSLTDHSPDNIRILVSGKGNRVGTTTTQLSFIEHNIVETAETFRQEIPLVSYEFTAELIIQFLTGSGLGTHVSPPRPALPPLPIALIGHRFVHGGDEFDHSELVTAQVREKLMKCLPLAPIHNPIALSVYEVCLRLLPTVPNYVTFDTAFHHTLPAEAATYAIPLELSAYYHKYGFHGLSYTDVTKGVERYLGGEGSLKGKKMVICHLGTGGSSVCATLSGVSVDTSMGFTPLPGLVMSTRCGDLDPAIPLDLIKQGKTADEVLEILNKKSGLLGLSTLSSDLRDIYQVAGTPSHPKCENCRLAFSVCVHRLRTIVGGMIGVLGGIDILAFTDGLGVEMPALRDAVCSSFAFCGIKIDKVKNEKATRGDQIGDISASDSTVKVLVVPNDEELVIAREGQVIAQELNKDKEQ